MLEMAVKVDGAKIAGTSKCYPVLW